MTGVITVFGLAALALFPLITAVLGALPQSRLLKVGICAISGLTGFAMAGAAGMAVGVAGGATLPSLLRRRWESTRLRKAGRQLPDALTLVASGLRAGLSARQALEIAAREISDPLGDELAKSVRMTQVGLGCTQTLEEVAIRCGHRDAAVALASIGFQQGAGGNMAGLLDRIALDMRDREALAGRLLAGTAQGRMTGMIVALVPIGLAVLMNSLAPDYLAPLVNLPTGRVMLVVAAILNVVGLYFISQLSKVTV